MNMVKVLAVILMALSVDGAFAVDASAQRAVGSGPSAAKKPSVTASMSLAEARSKIGECIADASKMAEIVKKLSSADQVSFLADVNDAISKMPGSNEAKAANYLLVNRAAVTASASGNKVPMFAEVFATVPPEVLPIVNERFAADLLNKDANPAQPVPNEQFTGVATNIMAKVVERCASVENGEVRSTFAILMLVNASNGSIPGLVDMLVKMLPASVQKIAAEEWIPAALGENQPKTYDPLLGYGENIGQMVANAVVLRLAGPQLLESMLGDIIEGTPLINNSFRNDIIPTSAGVREEDPKPQPIFPPPDEPGGYPNQWL